MGQIWDLLLCIMYNTTTRFRSKIKRTLICTSVSFGLNFGQIRHSVVPNPSRVVSDLCARISRSGLIKPCRTLPVSIRGKKLVKNWINFGDNNKWRGRVEVSKNANRVQRTTRNCDFAYWQVCSFRDAGFFVCVTVFRYREICAIVWDWRDWV